MVLNDNYIVRLAAGYLPKFGFCHQTQGFIDLWPMYDNKKRTAQIVRSPYFNCLSWYSGQDILQRFSIP